MLRFSLLGSGSSGNAALVTTPTTKILIDNGLSLKQLRLRLAAVGESLTDLSAVVISHEHSDHVLGLGVLTRQMAVPVYMTPATHEALPASLNGLNGVRHFESGDTLPLGDIEVDTFAVSHDAVDPVGFAVRGCGAKLGFATDLGHVSHVVRRGLAGAHALVIESNYCPKRLLAGHYPPRVQHRIRSRIGHLSNQDMCSLLAELLHDRLGTVVLMHISENNNNPDDVLALARGVMNGHVAKLHLAWQDRPTPLFEVRP
ncbi:MAG: MBL fold metallo-hydrolase [Candidatus Hydrogenedentota bacterium]